MRASPDSRDVRLGEDLPAASRSSTSRHREGRVRRGGLGNQFLAAIRECDAICEVVRVFVDDDVIHVDGRIDPASDVATIETTHPRGLQTVEKSSPVSTRSQARGWRCALSPRSSQKAQSALDQGLVISKVKDLDRGVLADMHLLTDKPFIYVFNVDEDLAMRRDVRRSRRRSHRRPQSSSVPRSKRNCPTGRG